MSDKSIIIIGGGIAGLAAGCYGQMNGFRTRIFEMHKKKPGGLCMAWKRHGYTADGCIHWLVGYRPGNRNSIPSGKRSAQYRAGSSCTMRNTGASSPWTARPLSSIQILTGSSNTWEGAVVTSRNILGAVEKNSVEQGNLTASIDEIQLISRNNLAAASRLNDTVNSLAQQAKLLKDELSKFKF